jgi:hypothetical protein
MRRRHDRAARSREAADRRAALWKNRSPETEKPPAAFLEEDAIKGIYLHGAKDPERISPDDWKSDFGFMQREHARRVQLGLFYDYRTNVDLYPKWQAFLRDRQPKTVIFRGQDDSLEEIATGIHCFYNEKVKP